jgi:hypothetical protein
MGGRTSGLGGGWVERRPGKTTSPIDADAQSSPGRTRRRSAPPVGAPGAGARDGAGTRAGLADAGSPTGPPAAADTASAHGGVGPRVGPGTTGSRPGLPAGAPAA